MADRPIEQMIIKPKDVLDNNVFTKDIALFNPDGTPFTSNSTTTSSDLLPYIFGFKKAASTLAAEYNPDGTVTIPGFGYSGFPAGQTAHVLLYICAITGAF